MPTYEYRCKSCGHEFEEFQSITAKPLRTCPSCKKPRLQRLIGTGAGIIFKGSGFYETDYRSESYKKAAKAEKESAAPAKSEGKSESASADKPAGKSESTAASTGSTSSAGKPKGDAPTKSVPKKPDPKS